MVVHSALQILLALVIAVSVRGDGYDAVPVSEVERCRQQAHRQQGEKLTTLEGTVGVGWDNLRNVPMAAVLNSTFLKCKMTPDGQYFISDDMEVLLVKRSQLDQTANYYEHYQDYFKETTDSINAEAGFVIGHFDISGSFSATHQEVKQKFFNEKSSLFRTSLYYHAYTVVSQPGTGLHHSFKARLLEIDNAISQNLTVMARYLSEMTIRDFGTHLITQADVGATIIQEDFINSKVDFSKTSTLDEMKAAASVGLFGALKFGSLSGRVTVKETTMEEFKSVLRHSQIRTRGGLAVNQLLSGTANGSISQGSVLVDDVITLDRTGVPLYTIISRNNLPELKQSNVLQITKFLKNATEKYYTMNARFGCMDADAANFDFQANINDTTCEQSFNNFTFGGIFQTCVPKPESRQSWFSQPATPAWRCDDLKQANGATGNFSCPEHYQPVNLFNIDHRLPDRHETSCTEDCDFFVFCSTSCHDIVYHDHVQLAAYWCNATDMTQLGENEGFMFGGLYGKGQINPFTGSSSCPGHFVAYHLAADLTVCLSRDYQLDRPYSVRFGGFFSCQTPPSLAKCPNGYSQHLATSIESCDVYYCVRPESFYRYKSAVAHRPPYDDLATLIGNETSSTIYIYEKNQLVAKHSVKDALKEMAELRNSSKTGRGVFFLQTAPLMSEDEAVHAWINTFSMSHRSGVSNQSTSKNGGSIIGIVIGAIAVIAFMAAVITISVVQIRKFNRNGYSAPIANPTEEIPLIQPQNSIQ